MTTRIATRWTAASLLGGALLGGLLLLGCGPNKEERGLTTSTEVGTPESGNEMAESEKQRDQQDVQGLEGKAPGEETREEPAPAP